MYLVRQKARIASQHGPCIAVINIVFIVFLFFQANLKPNVHPDTLTTK